MRKLFLFTACLIALCATAQADEIDAVSATQGTTTDWFRFDNTNRIHVNIDDLGNPEFPNDRLYDLSSGGNVHTAFGTAPIEKITLTAEDLVISGNRAIYDGEIKTVEVNMADESKILPSAANMTVYYSADKTLKQPINAGTYPIYIDIKDDLRYNDVEGLTSEDWTLTIAKADPTADLFTYTAPTGDAYYDGNTREAKVEFNDPSGQHTGMGNVTVKYNGSTEAPVAGGEYAVSIDIAEGANYNAAQGMTSEDWQFTIAKRTIEVNTNNFKINNKAVTYDGEEHYASVALNDEFVGAGAVTVTYKVGNTVVEKPINVGTYYIYVTIAEGDGYEAVPETKLGNRNLSITRATPTADMFTVTPPENLVYAEDGDGHYKTATVTFNDQNGKLTGMGTIRVDYKNVNTGETFLGEPVSAIGTYQVYLQIAQGGNYNGRLTADKVTSEDWQFTIVEPAPVDEWITVREDGVVGDWNTICLEKNITAIDGATFWTISGQDATSFILDEVTEPQAGYGYLIRFTKSELKVKYGSETAANPVTATDGNPIQGTYTLIDFDKTTGLNELVGNYVVYQNQLCMVEGYVGMYAHRAYVKGDLVPWDIPAQAPGRARAYMPKPKETPTGIGQWNKEQGQRTGKFLHKGQLIIVKDGKTYNAQGIRVYEL